MYYNLVLSQSCLGCFSSLPLYMNFGIGLIPKVACLGFDQGYIECMDEIGENGYLNNIKLSHLCTWNICLFRYFVVSFTSVLQFSVKVDTLISFWGGCNFKSYCIFTFQNLIFPCQHMKIKLTFYFDLYSVNLLIGFKKFLQLL